MNLFNNLGNSTLLAWDIINKKWVWKFEVPKFSNGEYEKGRYFCCNRESCGFEVIPVEGETGRLHHFRKKPESICNFLHNFVEELIVERKVLNVPAPLDLSYEEEPIGINAHLALKEQRFEIHGKYFQPDVVFYDAQNLPILNIEVVVTHDIDEKKAVLLQEFGVDSIRIDFTKKKFLFNGQNISDKIELAEFSALVVEHLEKKENFTWVYHKDLNKKNGGNEQKLSFQAYEILGLSESVGNKFGILSKGIEGEIEAAFRGIEEFKRQYINHNGLQLGQERLRGELEPYDLFRRKEESIRTEGERIEKEEKRMAFQRAFFDFIDSKREQMEEFYQIESRNQKKSSKFFKS